MAAYRDRRDDGRVDEQPPTRPTKSPLTPDQEPSGCTDGQAFVRGGWRHRHDAWQRGGPLRRQQEGRLVGFGIAVYVLAWLFLPAAGENGNIAGRAMSDRRGIALAAAAASLLALILLIGSLLKVAWLGSLSWPPVIALAGLVLIWRNASPEEQVVLRRLTEPL